MLAKKVDKGSDPRAYGPVAVVNRAKRHFNRQPASHSCLSVSPLLEDISLSISSS